LDVLCEKEKFTVTGEGGQTLFRSVLGLKEPANTKGMKQVRGSGMAVMADASSETHETDDDDRRPSDNHRHETQRVDAML
jgi:hypothetical protein